ELTLVQPRVGQTAGASNSVEIARLLDQALQHIVAPSLVVLPELVGSAMARDEYCEAVSQVAVRTMSWVVGGSHHWRRGGRVRNAGVVAAPTGELVPAYEKRNPYGVEVEMGVEPGDGPVVVDVDGCSVAVMICSDFWHSECIYELEMHPHVIA